MMPSSQRDRNVNQLNMQLQEHYLHSSCLICGSRLHCIRLTIALLMIMMMTRIEEIGTNGLLASQVVIGFIRSSSNNIHYYHYDNTQDDSSSSKKYYWNQFQHHHHRRNICICSHQIPNGQEEGNNKISDKNNVVTSTSSSVRSYDADEMIIIQQIAKRCIDAGNDTIVLQQIILQETIPYMSPSLIMKLRSHNNVSSTNNQQPDANDNNISLVSNAMNHVFELQIDQAKETLLTLLNAGEIRKLDNLIGHMARNNKLDVPFFNVLTANIQDSIKEDDDDESLVSSTSATSTTEHHASRTSILRHIYTRCQEEVEKTIPPGMALLNKLLRTNQQLIRMNLYQHYLLTPDSTINNDDDDKSNVIATPDGKKLKLISSSTIKPLIVLSDLIKAIDDMIIQIRTIENNNYVTKESGAQMVEACRTIAKEIRVTIIERYGIDSLECQELQDKLQKVFRPSSTDSPYIKGIQQQQSQSVQ